jgi:hypothetical protein
MPFVTVNVVRTFRRSAGTHTFGYDSGEAKLAVEAASIMARRGERGGTKRDTDADGLYK